VSVGSQCALDADHGNNMFRSDTTLVNGVPWPVVRVGPGKVRLRMLFSTLTRSFKLRLKGAADSCSATKLIVIGTDTELLATPVPTKVLWANVAERYQVVIDFTGCEPGTEILMMNAGHGGLNNRDALNTNKVAKFVVDPEYGASAAALPCFLLDEADGRMRYEAIVPAQRALDIIQQQGLTQDEENTVTVTVPAIEQQVTESAPCGVRQLQICTPEQTARVRTHVFKRQNGKWKINGHSWDDGNVDETRRVIAAPEEGGLEVWHLVNGGGGWHHPCTCTSSTAG